MLPADYRLVNRVLNGSFQCVYRKPEGAAPWGWPVHIGGRDRPLMSNRRRKFGLELRWLYQLGRRGCIGAL